MQVLSLCNVFLWTSNSNLFDSTELPHETKSKEDPGKLCLFSPALQRKQTGENNRRQLYNGILITAKINNNKSRIYSQLKWSWNDFGIIRLSEKCADLSEWNQFISAGFPVSLILYFYCCAFVNNGKKSILVTCCVESSDCLLLCTKHGR